MPSKEVTFEQLRVERKALNDAVLIHRQSVLRFKDPEHAWFRLDPAEPPKDEPVRHLSSTATCLESLHDVPDFAAGSWDQELVNGFAEAALRAHDDRWQSDRAARVYCRVRTLTPILRLTPTELLKPFEGEIREHIRYVWDRLNPIDPRFQGVSEAPERVEEAEEERVTYPPNAFHTYWAVRLIEEYNRHTGLAALADDIVAKRPIAELWSRQALAAQSALVHGKAERLDAQQLAWALSLEFLQTDQGPITAAAPRLELYRTALKAFFDQQHASGGWPLYEPLFHYPAAGNAYCYTFETLTELLRPALHETRGTVLRRLLRPQLPNLLRAWHFAQRTQMDTGTGTVGWCSGHHPHRRDPEAWATAEVFSYLQILRRLVGFWTAEEASTGRRGRRARWAEPASAKAVLRERGNNWTTLDRWTIGRRLAALFVHPLEALRARDDELDPDRPLVREDQARSAILFGPPGTSKTTLVEAIAGVMGWQYVEVHAADFLSEGMDQVPARADAIFAQLMELDRCVVLFDEIDELIRERQAAESDPFGRFLTTSMLPKLAKLWEQRRILYFVATNDIEAADPAIKRSQRFDATLYVSPPSYDVKAALLTEALGQLPGQVTETAITDALTHSMDLEHALGVVALLRFDQVTGLAERLRAKMQNGVIAEDTLKRVLLDMGEELQSVEWRRLRSGTSTPVDPYETFRDFAKADGRDARMLQLLTVSRQPESSPPCSEFFREGDSIIYYKVVGPLESRARLVQGRWVIDAGGQTLRDEGLLDFGCLDDQGAA